MNVKMIATIAAGLMLTISTGTFAQNTAPQGQPAAQGRMKGPKLTPEERADQQVANLDATVHLTADQKTKVKQLFIDQRNQALQNKAAAGGDANKMKELNKTLAKQKRDALKQILTPEQQLAWKQQKMERKAERMGNNQNSQPAPNK